MDNQLGSDLLSDLPLDIIESILMLLPIRDAIRTSILSSKWRYRWVGLPQLDFDEESMGPPLGDAIHEECHLKEFVTRTLFHHQGPIHKFKLHVTCMDSCPNTDEWLLFLSGKDVKELILGIDEFWNEDFRLPSCLYSCRNLTLLELFGCQFGPPPPDFEGFLCLRSLILKYVDVPSGTIESLVANSSLLENLECTYSGRSELRISAPNLKYVSLEGTYKEIYLCAPLLAKLSVTLEDEDGNGYRVEEIPWTHSVCNYAKFLGGFTNLETLIGDGSFTKYLGIGIKHCHHLLVFHHLEVIKLCQVNFDDMNEISFVVRLIMGAANLRSLQVQSYRDKEDASKTPRIHLWDFKCPKRWTFKKLETIKMTEFSGALREMKFISLLLVSSPVLETLIIEPVQITQQEILDLIVEWLSYLRASTNAEILFKKS